jgi:hypothetical protein
MRTPVAWTPLFPTRPRRVSLWTLVFRPPLSFAPLVCFSPVFSSLFLILLVWDRLFVRSLESHSRL